MAYLHVDCLQLRAKAALAAFDRFLTLESKTVSPDFLELRRAAHEWQGAAAEIVRSPIDTPDEAALAIALALRAVADVLGGPTELDQDDRRNLRDAQALLSSLVQWVEDQAPACKDVLEWAYESATE